MLSVIFLHTVDPFITSTSRFTEIHLVLFSKLFPLTAVLSKFTKHTHNKISVAPRKQIHRSTIYVSSCCGSRNRTRRSTADNYQPLMIPAKGSLINIWRVQTVTRLKCVTCYISDFLTRWRCRKKTASSYVMAVMRCTDRETFCNTPFLGSCVWLLISQLHEAWYKRHAIRNSLPPPQILFVFRISYRQFHQPPRLDLH